MGLRGGQRVDDIDRGGEEHRVAAQAGGVAEGDAQVALAQADGADEDDVGVVLDEAQAKEVLDLGSVDLLRPAPVELIEGLEHREAGQSHAPLDAALFAPVGLAFDEPRQILDVGPLLGTGLLCQGFKVLVQKGQFESSPSGRTTHRLRIGDQLFMRHRPHRVTDRGRGSRCPADPGGGSGERARLGVFAGAHLEDVGDVLAAVGFEGDAVLDGPVERIDAVDLGQGDDLAQVMARVQAPLLESLRNRPGRCARGSGTACSRRCSRALRRCASSAFGWSGSSMSWCRS